MSNSFTRLVREPLVQFLLIGTAIYALYFFYGEAPLEEKERTIVVTADYINSLNQNFAKRWNRPPTEEEMQGLVSEYVRESLLYHEALAMGLDKEDHIIRRRLAQKLEFLTTDLIKLTPPEDSVLQEYLNDNIEKFRGSDLLTFIQIFVDPDKRGDSALDDAAILLETLRAAGPPGEEAFELGDRFMLQSVFSTARTQEIQRQMGQEFTDAVVQLEPGQWHGPVLSGYGIHLVYVSEHIVAADPVLNDVRNKLVTEYTHEQTQKFNAEYLDVLRSRYTIIIEEPPEGVDLIDKDKTTP